jgi:hypothetical protein
MQILSPLPYQVLQREGFVAKRQHKNALGGPQRGYADVTVRCAITDEMHGYSWQYRLLPTLTVQDQSGVAWTPFTAEVVSGELVATLHLSAGWFRLEIGGFIGEQLQVSASVSPVGVGEVFIIAGQSYGEGCNEALLSVQDPQQRVTIFDTVAKHWRVAHDPPPNRYVGGTIWLPMCDMLAGLLRVPIGLVNVAVGGTASRQWLPGEDLYNQLRDAGLAIGRFRAVLWQQGESDIIEGMDSDGYCRNILAIRDSLAAAWGFRPLWLPAKSTYHPLAYTDPAGEEKIRAAMDRLWCMPGFYPGADTDILADENRGDWEHMAHFMPIGQQRASQLWFVAVWNALHAEG